jgi:hypothetical protein
MLVSLSHLRMTQSAHQQPTEEGSSGEEHLATRYLIRLSGMCLVNVNVSAPSSRFRVQFSRHTQHLPLPPLLWNYDMGEWSRDFPRNLMAASKPSPHWCISRLLDA